MREISYTTYSDEHIPEIIKFWNKSFSGWPNAIRMTANRYRSRVVNIVTGVEAFEPQGMILAFEGKNLVGYCHSGTRNEVVCKRVYQDWPGGSEGFIALIFVSPSHRSHGIGTELIKRAKLYLYGTKRIVIDGQVFNPFYGNSTGPGTCFFGTTEGISIPDDDEKTKAFLSKEGFEKRYTGIALEVPLSRVSLKRVAESRSTIEEKGVIFKSRRNAAPVILLPERITQAYVATQEYDSFFAEKQGTVLGVVVSYPMKGLISKEKKSGIYHLEVAEEARGMGLGGALLSSALAELKSRRKIKKVEALSLEEVSPQAINLYKKVGFEEIRRWAIY
ncbi:MAG: GNAT family N-acetyltransferase [Planctomycetota bacterium]|jgi:ribosomal protein S18 acetylase RimI-like enzyme